MTLLTTAPRRLGRPVTLGQALGAADENAPLRLNTPEAAACQRCGAEPRLYHHVSPRGRDVEVWIPAEHVCSGKRVAG